MPNHRKPTALKIISGVAKSTINQREPVSEVVAPPPPPSLSANAKAHWLTVIDKLAAAKIMTALDVDALAIYCEAYARWIEANNDINVNGILIETDRGGLKANPYIKISDTAFNQMRKILIEFGMTPASRSKVVTAGPGKNSGWDEFK